MAENLFTDYPDRVAQLTQYSKVEEIIPPLEELFGEKDYFKSGKEGIEFYHGVLSELGKVLAKEIAPNAEAIDKQGLSIKDGEVVYPEKLKANLALLKAMGFFDGQVSRKYGGMNLPRVVQALALEMLSHACPNTGLTVAVYSMGEFVEQWGTEEQKEKYLSKILSCDVLTSMALTEAGAGSDLGKIRTKVRSANGKYYVDGTKQFITNGDGDITFALVRTDPTSTGLKGLSVLIVPKKREDGSLNIRLSKIEDKVCLHGSPTCEIVFEDSEAEMFGPEGEGFKVMLDLMNSARLAMSALALGISTHALELSKKYATERVTMGKPIIQHPMVADMIYEMEMETRAIRAMVMEASRSADWMAIYEEKKDEKNFKKWTTRYRRLTPLCKYYSAEKCITMTRNAVQIFGGYGVCKEYPVERLYRESVIFPIYEGTSQIQSLMVLKDTLKDVAGHSTGFLGSLAGAWAESKVTRDPVKSVLLQARNELNQGIKTILMSIIKDKFKSDIDSLKENKIQEFLEEFSLKLLTSKTDLTYPFLLAERFTRITCDYYALKCMTDNTPDSDTERRKWILDYAELILPRMRMENTYMLNRLPSTLTYMKQFASL